MTMTHRKSQRTSWAVFDHQRAQQQHDRSRVREQRGLPEFIDELIALGLDPTTLEQDGTLNALGFDLQHSTADNLLNARRGYQIAFHAEQAGRLVPGTFNYYAVSADARHYLPLGERLVVASRAQIGNIRPVGQRSDATCRSRRSIFSAARRASAAGDASRSARSADGVPIGGNSMLAFSAELRATLRGKLGGVLFLDAGNVWAESGAFDLNDLRYAVGPGLALPDADRPDPLRRRLSSSIRFPGCW